MAKTIISGLTLLIVLLQNAKTDGTSVSCYLPSWPVYRATPWNYSIKSVPSNSCDVLIYAFVGVDNVTWGIKVLNPDTDIDMKGFADAVDFKQRSPNTKVLVALGGGDEGVKKYSDMVSLKSRRTTFINSAVQFITKYGFDGMDLDWEFPGDIERGGRTTDKDNFSLLVKEMSAKFQDRQWLLTAALTTFRGSVEAAYDIPKLSKYLDKMHIMTYDMRGPWTTTGADNHSPLYRRDKIDVGSVKEMNVNDTMHLYTSLGAPASKLYVGIPFYGRTFTLKYPKQTIPGSPVTGVGNPGQFSNDPGSLAYFEICTLLNTGRWTKGFDDIAKVPYAYTGDQWVGYDDPSSIHTKVKFIRDNGYGGAMAWSLDQDDFLGNCGVKNPLLMAIKKK